MFPNFSIFANKYPRRLVLVGALIFLGVFALYLTFFCSELKYFTRENMGTYKTMTVEFTGVVTSKESFGVIVEKNNVSVDGTVPIKTLTNITLTPETKILKTGVREGSFAETDIPKLDEDVEIAIQKEPNLQIILGTIDDIVVGSKVSVTEKIIENYNGQKKEALQVMIFPDSADLTPST